MSNDALESFATGLAKWNTSIERNMPWEGEKDPYLIWLSEIILQQTRVTQGLPYFQKFKKAYPTICDLANAKDDEVLRLWQGLGYYSRCRNLLHTARVVCNEFYGVFPKNYSDILKLKGIGSYTAAAISSFAFNGMHAVVDGNVKRVISRYFGIEEAIDAPKGVKIISDTTQSALIAHGDPGEYNQSIMNFGALICTPKGPLCRSCPLSSSCSAYSTSSVDRLPFKSKKIKRKDRFFHFLHIETKEAIMIEQRRTKDIWQQLYQLPMAEHDEFVQNQSTIHTHEVFEGYEIRSEHIKHQSAPYKQQLTHQRINAVFLNIYLDEQIDVVKKGYLWIRKEDLNNYAFPKVILDYLQGDIQQALPL